MERQRRRDRDGVRIMNNLPNHVAIIMDGNGRWAVARRLPRFQGHIEGVRRVEDVIRVALQKRIGYLTLFAFSTENWLRPPSEIQMLMKTMCSVLDQKLNQLIDNGVRVRFIGRRKGLADEVLRYIDTAETKTAEGKRLTVNVAFNYGGRAEIVDAARSLACMVREGRLDPERIDEMMIERHLHTAGQPDPDLLIRTSGEMRISNFLLWQISYTELLFTDVLWPDFTTAEFEKALEEFTRRKRRFGGVPQEQEG